MVDPAVLANDIVATVVSVLVTPALWLGLFLWAWTRPQAAHASGFGRMTFWLLLPGAFLASAANAPFFYWTGDVLAINIGGALVPILLSLILLRNSFGGAEWRPVGTFVLFLTAETVLEFAAVVLIPSPTVNTLVVGGIGAGTVLVAAVVPIAWTPRASEAARTRLRGVTVLGLTSGALVVTFLNSQAIPGLGIVSSYPAFLLAPVAVGVLAVVAARGLWKAPGVSGLAAGYAAATWGTLLGADLLRQPPLYGSGPAALFAIGGAGIQDLVYLAGLLAAGAGLFACTVWPRFPRPALAVPASPPASPDAFLRSAAELVDRGEISAAIVSSVAAAEASAQRARGLWQIPPPEGADRAWDALPVAGYVRSDYRNLRAQLGVPMADLREGRRSLLMASFLVRLGKDLGRLRFAALPRRALATVIDFALVTTPAALLVIGLALRLPGTSNELLAGLPLNTVVFGYVAYAFLYFVLLDRIYGASVGKRFLRLAVTDRRLARPSLLQSLLREAPKLVPIAALGYGAGPALVLLLHPQAGVPSPLGINFNQFAGALLLGTALVVVLIAFAFGAILVSRGAERQRLGDQWAATWVVDRRTATPAWGAARSAPAPEPAPAPSG